ncbi:transposase [Sphingomonas sp. PP-CE-3G-477]|uniref:transposase n=1 Tax=Sphingomonas sp. PP-CE-3G-477 TaxID=2135660 RepID=UPI002158BD89|nr:transposase [Sphingomonas sp. PP-CE-3G-477]
MVLICKDKKTGDNYTELDALRRQVESLAKVRRYEAPGGHSGDLNDKVANRNAGEKKKAKKNHFTADQAAELKAMFLDQLYGYQEAWFEALSFRTVVEGFHEMIRRKTEEDLVPWIERGRGSLVASFANGIARDVAAVRAAIVTSWSNGQTEGQITKLKLVKRQMYGRGKLDLLEARLVGTAWL